MGNTNIKLDRYRREQDKLTREIVREEIERAVGKVVRNGRVIASRISTGGDSGEIPSSVLPVDAYDDRYSQLGHEHGAIEITSGQFIDARISESSVTQYAPSQAAFDNHSARHEQGGSDALEISSLATVETNTDKVLRPDGSGGISWENAPSNGGGSGGATEIDDLTDVNTSGKGDGNFLSWNDAESEWRAVEAPSGNGASATDFTALSDTPESYDGQAGKVLAVNSAEDALSFIDPPLGVEEDPTILLSGEASSSSVITLNWEEIE